MKLKGLPYSDKVKLNELNEQKGIPLEIPLYNLILYALREHKNYVVFFGKYCTWLDDICLDYKEKICFLPYFVYDVYDTAIIPNEKSLYYKHLLLDGNKVLKVRHNFEVNYHQVVENDILCMYSIKDNQFYSVTIKGFMNEEDKFSVELLYELYRNACFYDYVTDISQHESGYTYIEKQYKGFSNREHFYRTKLKLQDYKDTLKDIRYADVRYYNYFEGISKYPSIVNSNELFKYRNLEFENYLFCCLQSNKKPIDCNEWHALGKTKRYIKIKGDVPFFIKYYWLNDFTLKDTESWLIV